MDGTVQRCAGITQPGCRDRCDETGNASNRAQRASGVGQAWRRAARGAGSERRPEALPRQPGKAMSGFPFPFGSMRLENPNGLLPMGTAQLFSLRAVTQSKKPPYLCQQETAQTKSERERAALETSNKRVRSGIPNPRGRTENGNGGN